jgi:hypothetical protein
MRILNEQYYCRYHCTYLKSYMYILSHIRFLPAITMHHSWESNVSLLGLDESPYWRQNAGVFLTYPN